MKKLLFAAALFLLSSQGGKASASSRAAYTLIFINHGDYPVDIWCGITTPHSPAALASPTTIAPHNQLSCCYSKTETRRPGKKQALSFTLRPSNNQKAAFERTILINQAPCCDEEIVINVRGYAASAYLESATGCVHGRKSYEPLDEALQRKQTK